ncbi:A/G-specific adenine glycosylase [Kozakia baliensis]|uniref:A/G-specific adenine glycosylase n=1 Tax=Kozakia baliensis TaxID=153496 RepID=UPI00345B7DDB
MIPSASALLDWYERHRRDLPWRAPPGGRTPPYHVWLSEIMLQQTTVVTVKPYYSRFLSRYPTIEALAKAPQEDVLAAWAGLGYYTRARNLHACAQQIAALGAFPSTVPALRALPGIGDYTARAIAAIAFGVPVVPVDGNVERVTSRLFAIDTPLPAARRLLAQQAAILNTEPAAQANASDFAQALFDLGATICTPRAPTCILCPWQPHCSAYAQGIAEKLPVKAPRGAKPQKYGACFVLRDRHGAVWLRRRPEKGLLAGMTELPGTNWRLEAWSEQEALSHAPAQAEWREVGFVTHVFTHLTLQLTVYDAQISEFRSHPLGEGFSCSAQALEAQALPSVMRKCLALAGLS